MFDTLPKKSRPLQNSITSHRLFLFSHLSFELPSPSHVENTKNHKRQQPQSVELGRSQVGHTGVERSMFFRHARIPVEVCKRFGSITASLNQLVMNKTVMSTLRPPTSLPRSITLISLAVSLLACGSCYRFYVSICVHLLRIPLALMRVLIRLIPILGLRFEIGLQTIQHGSTLKNNAFTSIAFPSHLWFKVSQS